ncbi:MAG TPA: patatin-like phospholipase family protein, partial [Anaeromyxobacteraceae bacterium]
MVRSLPSSRLLALALTALCLPAWADAPQAGASRAPPRRFALTISGGVSLGAYEAGATWAFLRFMRRIEEGGPAAARPQLAVATGASAGSLNATLAALAWCLTNDTSTVGDNPFLRAWRGVALEALLPAEWRAYRPDDALLARAALEPAERELRALLATSGARACQVRLGITASADQPLVTPVAGLTVKDQTVAIPLQISVRAGGRPTVRSQRLPQRRVAGDLVLHLSGDRAGEDGEVEVEADQLLGAVKASGAFPVAFSAMTLTMCVEGCPARDQELFRYCPVPGGPPVQGRACRGAFRDGGVFDNTPLQLAVELAEAAPGGAEASTVYLYVDPDLRRSQARLTGAETAAARPGPGLARELAFFAAAATYARERSLYEALRGSRWNRDLPQLLGAAAEGLRELRRLAPSEAAWASRAAPLARAEPAALRAFTACAPADRASLLEVCLPPATGEPSPPLTAGERAAFASAARDALSSLAGRGEPESWSGEALSLET